nr:vp80 capsid protein [Calliteara abietis nucleopolyhedrovirus]
METLIIKGNKYKFKCVPMQGDGSCVFRSLAHVIFGDAEGHLQIRQTVVNYIVKHWDHYKDFVTPNKFNVPYRNSEEYARDMLNPMTFATVLEIKVAADLYQIYVKIIKNNKILESVGDPGHPIKYLKFSGTFDSGHMDVYENVSTLQTCQDQNLQIINNYLQFLTIYLKSDSEVHSEEAMAVFNNLKDLDKVSTLNTIDLLENIHTLQAAYNKTHDEQLQKLIFNVNNVQPTTRLLQATPTVLNEEEEPDAMAASPIEFATTAAASTPAPTASAAATYEAYNLPINDFALSRVSGADVVSNAEIVAAASTLTTTTTTPLPPPPPTPLSPPQTIVNASATPTILSPSSVTAAAAASAASTAVVEEVADLLPPTTAEINNVISHSPAVEAGTATTVADNDRIFNSFIPTTTESRYKAQHEYFSFIIFRFKIADAANIEFINAFNQQVSPYSIYLHKFNSNYMEMGVKFEDIKNRSPLALFVERYSHPTTSRYTFSEQLKTIICNTELSIVDREPPTVRQAMRDLLTAVQQSIPYVIILSIDEKESRSIISSEVADALQKYGSDHILLTPSSIFMEFNKYTFKPPTMTTHRDPSMAVDILVETVQNSDQSQRVAQQRRQTQKRARHKQYDDYGSTTVTADEDDDYVDAVRRIYKRARPNDRSRPLMLPTPPPPTFLPASYFPPPQSFSPPTMDLFDGGEHVVRVSPTTAQPGVYRSKEHLDIPAVHAMPQFFVDVITTISNNVDDLYLTCPTTSFTDVPNVFNFIRALGRIRQLNLSNLTFNLHFKEMLSPLSYYCSTELSKSQVLWFISRAFNYFVACLDNYPIIINEIKNDSDRDRIFVFIVKYNFLYHYKNFIKTLTAASMTAFYNQKIIDIIQVYNKLLQQKMNCMSLSMPMLTQAPAANVNANNKLVRLLVDVPPFVVQD